MLKLPYEEGTNHPKNRTPLRVEARRRTSIGLLNWRHLVKEGDKPFSSFGSLAQWTEHPATNREIEVRVLYDLPFLERESCCLEKKR